jgi:hypothetical protein
MIKFWLNSVHISFRYFKSHLSTRKANLELAFPPSNLNDVGYPGFAGVRIYLVERNISGKMEVVDGNLEVATAQIAVEVV